MHEASWREAAAPPRGWRAEGEAAVHWRRLLRAARTLLGGLRLRRVLRLVLKARGEEGALVSPRVKLHRWAIAAIGSSAHERGRLGIRAGTDPRRIMAFRRRNR